MACSLVSLLTGQAVKREVAMTGEITLRGRVLPVGGLKEKLLAAVRAGVQTVIVPEENAHDVEALAKKSLGGLRVILARTMDDVLKTALEVRARKKIENRKQAGESQLSAKGRQKKKVTSNGSS
jgi:ATP-dependent Lon protease